MQIKSGLSVGDENYACHEMSQNACQKLCRRSAKLFEKVMNKNGKHWGISKHGSWKDGFNFGTTHFDYLLENLCNSYCDTLHVNLSVTEKEQISNKFLGSNHLKHRRSQLKFLSAIGKVIVQIYMRNTRIYMFFMENKCVILHVI